MLLYTELHCCKQPRIVSAFQDKSNGCVFRSLYLTAFCRSLLDSVVSGRGEEVCVDINLMTEKHLLNSIGRYVW